MSRLLYIVLTALIVASCAPQDDPVRVGAKGFAEQSILAESLAALVRADGTAAEVVPCGDTWDCRAALADGGIDLMVEYTGTALRFAGLDPHAADATDRIDEAYAGLGTTWVSSLGFENAYRLYVSPERAGALQSPTISALAGAGPIVIAAPPEFVRRPGDGLGALTTRHGITQGGDPLLIQDPMERYRAVLEGRADVVVGYTTDGALLGLDLVELDDTLEFFPRYDAGVMARIDGRMSTDGIAAVATTLAEHLDETAVQRLNFSVEVEGRRAAAVAHEFLRENELLLAADGTGAALTIARYPGDELDGFETDALVAVRATFEGRSTAIAESDDAVEDVVEGAHRLALLTADRFFGPDGRDDRLEAAAVVGQQLAHVMVREGTAGVDGSFGLPNEASGAAAVATALVPDATVAARGTTAELLDELRSGALDAALVFGPAGDRRIREALAAGGLRLQPVHVGAGAGSARTMPFLIDARIPAGAYPSQAEAVDTVGVQVVLAAVSREFAASAAAGGPATALPATGTPLSRAQVERLSNATGAFQAPHPALPSAWTPPPAPVDAPVFSSARALDTTLNAGTIAFLFFVVLQTMRPRRRTEG